MGRFRFVLPLTFALMLATSSVIDAATTYSDTISGAEYWATSETGYFAGLADGDLPGWFDVTVVHTPLDRTATITGGSFTVWTVIADSATTVSGTFSGGTVRQLPPFGGCKDQRYIVTGTLANVGSSGGGSGTGAFNATLVHHRAWVENVGCVTYFATISGTVSLSF